MANFPSVIIVLLCWITAQSLALSLPPTTVYFEEGQKVELVCPRSPEPHKWERISWETTNGHFLAAGNKLVIEKATTDHEGEYRCRKQKFSGGHYSDTAVVYLVQKNKEDDSEEGENTSDEGTDVRPHQNQSDINSQLKNETLMSPNLNQTSDVSSKNDSDLASSSDVEAMPKNASLSVEDKKTELVAFEYEDEDDDTKEMRESRSSDKRMVCLPNQIKCQKSHLTGILPGVNCIMKHWLCDGENDCYNGWDEENCNVADECFPQMYKCKNSNVQIPMGYRCDEEKDCESGDDEENCLNPLFTSPNGGPRVEHVRESIKGHRIELKCSAQGFPSPVIVWRHNGEEVSKKHSIKETCANSPLGFQTSESVLSISSDRDGDAGYYTCEANNNSGRSFSPDYFLRIR